MARTNMTSTRVKPETAQLVTLRVLRSQRISPHFVRVTLGEGDIEQFRYLGFDQWFRLFIPVSDDSLSRLPNATKVNLPMYLKYLRIAKTDRPVLRNYSVRAFRSEGPEIDVDFVVHGHGDDAGPAATWAQNCRNGDPVAIIDEGRGFNPDASLRRVTLVADESGLPAAAGILASLDADVTGQALLEIPDAADEQELRAPEGVAVTWLPRDGSSEVPGRLALATAMELPLPAEPFYGWVVGEQQLPTGLRRHWVKAGVPKQNIMFCGYWRTGKAAG